MKSNLVKIAIPVLAVVLFGLLTLCGKENEERTEPSLVIKPMPPPQEEVVAPLKEEPVIASKPETSEIPFHSPPPSIEYPKAGEGSDHIIAPTEPAKKEEPTELVVDIQYSTNKTKPKPVVTKSKPTPKPKPVAVKPQPAKKFKAGEDYDLQGIYVKDPDVLGFFVTPLHEMNAKIEVKVKYEDGTSRTINLLLNDPGGGAPLNIWVNGINTSQIQTVEINLLMR